MIIIKPIPCTAEESNASSIRPVSEGNAGKTDLTPAVCKMVIITGVVICCLAQ